MPTPWSCGWKASSAFTTAHAGRGPCPIGAAPTRAPRGRTRAGRSHACSRERGNQRSLTIAAHELVERGASRRELLEWNAVQRCCGGVVQIVELGGVRFIDVDEPRHVFIV